MANAIDTFDKIDASLYQLLGIPESYSVTISTFTFLLAIAPYFQGKKVFGTTFPRLNVRIVRVGLVLWPVIFLLSVVSFHPRLFKVTATGAQRPFCYINNTVQENGKYNVFWLSAGEEPTVSDLGGNIVDQRGSYKFDWDPENVFITYTLRTTNRWGTCEARTTVWNPLVNWDEPLTCELSSTISEARAGDNFTLSWRVSGPSATIARVNNAKVDMTDSATYTFPINSKGVRFVLTAQTKNETCEGETIIARSNQP